MTLATRLDPVRSYEPVPAAEWTKTYTEASLSRLCDAGYIDGYTVLEGATDHALLWRGDKVVQKVALNTPLCAGCENPLDAGVCHSCELVTVLDLEAVPLGGGRFGVSA